MADIRTLKFSEGEFEGQDISSLSDTPSADGMSAAQLKARFDNIGKAMVALGRFNDLIDALVSGTEGASGAGSIGISLPSGMAGNVQQTIDALRQAISEGGYGDMLKADYDTDNNGKVDVADDADKLGGQPPTYYARAGSRYMIINKIRGYTGVMAFPGDTAKGTFPIYSDEIRDMSGGAISLSDTTADAEFNTLVAFEANVAGMYRLDIMLRIINTTDPLPATAEAVIHRNFSTGNAYAYTITNPVVSGSVISMGATVPLGVGDKLFPAIVSTSGAFSTSRAAYEGKYVCTLLNEDR